MTTIRKRYEASQRKKVLGMLKEVEKRIRDGVWIVENSGWWQGTPGTYTIKVVVKEKDGFVEEPEQF